MSLIVDGPHFGQAAACEPILRALPGWFGIEPDIVQYVADIEHLPTFLARRAEQVIGFLTVKQHNPYAAEILVMGVRPEAHRQGVGRALVNKAQEWSRVQGIEYLQVKTLGPSHSDESYARTRAFYEALAFRPLEEFKQLWDEQNPCLIMVKRL